MPEECMNMEHRSTGGRRKSEKESKVLRLFLPPLDCLALRFSGAPCLSSFDLVLLLFTRLVNAGPVVSACTSHQIKNTPHPLQARRVLKYYYRSGNKLTIQIIERLEPEVLCFQAQLFFDADELVILGDTVGAAGGASFDLAAVGGNRDIRDGRVFGFTRAM